MSFGLRKHVGVAYSHSQVGTAFKMHATELPAIRSVSPQNELSSSNLIPQTHIYALKRRLVAPSWWVLGVLLSQGTKEAWFDHLASQHLGKVIASPANINSKNIRVLFTIWHEIISNLALKSKNAGQLRFELSKHVSGTQQDIQEVSHQIENIWSQPLKLFEVKHANRIQSVSLSKFGSLSFIRHAQIEQDVDGVWLTLNLSQSYRDICQPLELSGSQSSFAGSLISISPIVLRSMGTRASTKKILNYLFLEYAKHIACNKDSNWNSLDIASQNMTAFHKEVLSNSSSWYDHGILGWNNTAPNMKISELKSQSHRNPSGVVFSWPVSQQAEQACKLEISLSEKIMTCDENVVPVSAPFQEKKTLFPEPPPDELKNFRDKNIREKKEIEFKKRRVVEKSQTLFDDSALYENMRKKAKVTHPVSFKKFSHPVDAISDTEFMVLVSEFYESLKPLQKRAFENERRGMTKEQFRSYMVPILQRKKNSMF